MIKLPLPERKESRIICINPETGLMRPPATDQLEPRLIACCVCVGVTTFRFISYQRFTLFSPGEECQQHSLPTADPTIELRHIHTCKLWRESVILFSCAPQLIYLTVTHSCKHLWELCQTEVNLRLALSALASKAHFFFPHLPLPKSSQLPWLCHVRRVYAGVSVCVHRAHFAALKFYDVARFRKSKRISADVKQLMSVYSESKSTAKQP